MKKSTVKIPNELEDDLRPHYDVDYSNSRPNRFAGRVGFTHGGALERCSLLENRKRA